MAKQKNPGSDGTLRGPGEHTPAVIGAAYHKKQHAVHDALWDACRDALDAAAEREARAAAKLKAAALILGFTQNENAHWTNQCPHCGRRVRLFQTHTGQVIAYSEFGGERCHAIPSIQRWLCDEGFQS